MYVIAVVCAAAVSPHGVVAATTTYKLTVTESSSTMTYGGTSPTFRAYLTPPSDDPPLAGNTPFYIRVGSTSYVGSLSYTPPTYVLYFNGLGSTSLTPGSYSVVAEYQSPKHGLLTSAPITLTVLKETPNIQCSVTNWANTYAPTTLLNISVGTGYAGGTFSVTFAGPRTYTSAPATSNGSGQFVASTPATAGVYLAYCNFSGNAIFNRVSVRLNPSQITISANNLVAGIALFTNPTPVTSGTLTTWLVVVYGRSGLPAPTGYVGVAIGRSYTKLMQLGSGGRLTFQGRNPSISPSDKIQVGYNGDPVYASSIAYFPLATARIPAAPPSTNGATATPSGAPLHASPSSQYPTPIQGSTPAASSTPASSTRVVSVLVGAASSSGKGRLVPYLIALLAAAIVGALSGTFMVRRGRRIAATNSPRA
jgi:hypothetical protein